MIRNDGITSISFSTLFVLLSLLFLHSKSDLAVSAAESSQSSQSSPDDAAVTTKLPLRSIGEMEGETGFFQAIAITDNSPIYQRKSKYQDIAVYDAKAYYGRILALDGVVQLTEKDADAYNEMMAHIPMFQHNEPKRVLIIGGGDGYVLSEVLKHPSVEHVDHVDLDEDVIDVCKQYFSWGDAWNDPRVTLHIADGAAFVRNTKSSTYDIVIQDSSDPWTWMESEDGTTKRVALPSSVLYEDEHFKHINRILSPNGMFNMQAETFQIPSDLEGISEWRIKALNSGFQRARYGSLYISSYPTGQIGFLLCEKNGGEQVENPSFLSSQQIMNVRKRHAIMQDQKKTRTSYYHSGLQQSSFDLPLWVHNEIYKEHPPAMVCMNVDNSTVESS